MKRPILAGWTAAALLLILGLALAPTQGFLRVSAASTPPPGPDRFTTVNVDYTSYEWWLIRWSDNAIGCRILIDHEDIPTGDEIYDGCGEDKYDSWLATGSCPQAAEGGDVSACKGYYLHFVQSTLAQKEVGVELPPAVVWVSLSGCTAGDSTNLCRGQPTLVLTGEEPLSGEQITGIGVVADEEEYLCDPVCQIELPPTDDNGLELAFWAYSSYGDTSPVFEAQVRVVLAGSDPSGESTWYVDVLSTQWRGIPLASCAWSWNSFPPAGGLPVWLSTPNRSEELTSTIPYEYLAANLITKGMVDVTGCSDNGLLENGMASQCGLEAARPAVNEWQNRFDGLIFNVAQETGVPAQLLKNLFSRESQFWPGGFTAKSDVGLGQLTENGADTALLWNPSFYEQFCPLVLDDDVCRQRYAFLQPKDQAILRGALVQSVDAVCSDCPLGINLDRADFSVSIFAQTLLASCEQTGSILWDLTGQPPGEVSTYEDLWRFSLVDYNAGPGCLILALGDTYGAGEPLDWEHVSAFLTPVCQGSKDYVNDISR